MAFEDLFRRRFTEKVDMDIYEPDFAEREMARMIAARAQATSPARAPARGRTGVHGAALKQFAEQEGARAAALGQLRGKEKARRIVEFRKASYQKTLERIQAERAAKAQQARLRKATLGAIGSIGEEGVDIGTNIATGAYGAGGRGSVGDPLAAIDVDELVVPIGTGEEIWQAPVVPLGSGEEIWGY